METLTHIFDWLLAATARASLLTLLVLGARVLLRHRAPARWLYALWLPVLIVLLMPALPESRWSVGSIVSATPAPLPAPVVLEQGPALTAAMPEVAPLERPASISWRQIMGLCWLVGAVGLLLFCLGASIQTLGRVKRSRVPVSDALLNEVAVLAREIGLRRAPRVWMASVIPGPAVTGFLNPILLLPAQFDETLTAQEVRLVLRHELTHIKRGDLPLNTLLCLLLALHWFNPLLWLAFFKVRLDREAACDAQVLCGEQQSQRVAYGHTLLKVERSFSRNGLSLGFVGIFQRGAALRSRVQLIATQPKQHPFMKIIISLSIALLTFLGITKAAPPDTNAPQILIEAKFIEVGEDTKDFLELRAVGGAFSFPEDAGAVPLGEGVWAVQKFGAFWNHVEAAKDVDILSTPRVTTRSGQKATIEIGSEFAYKDAEGKSAIKKLGTTLTLLPRMTGENQFDLEMTPQIVKHEGMIKLEGGVAQPVFSERKVTSRALMTSGQTVVLAMPPTSKKQTTDESEAGRVTTTTKKVTRGTLVFVTARIIDPATCNAVDTEAAAEKMPLAGKLDVIAIPQIQFHETPLSDALEYLQRKSVELDTTTTDPNKKGVNIILQTSDKASEAKITMKLSYTSLSVALKYVAQLSGLQLVIEPHGVLLLSRADFEARQKQAGSSAPNKTGMIIAAKSISIDKGTGAVDANGDVKIKTSQGTISTEQAKLETKPTAGKIILPKVHFHEATLAEAVEFLRIKSRDLDPEKKGLSIVVNPGGNPTAKITMQLKDVPAYEALRYIAALAGHTLTVDGDVFVIAPAGVAR